MTGPTARPSGEGTVSSTTPTGKNESMSTDLGKAREATIAQYDVLGQPEVEGLHDLVLLAAQLFDVPDALVNLIDNHHQHSVAAATSSTTVCEAKDSMCARSITLPGTVVISDAAADPRFATLPHVNGQLSNIRFYAASPLVTPAGVTIGTLCIFDTAPRHLPAAKVEALEALARRVVEVLELRRSARELSRSNEQLTAFAGQVSHDLRNPLTGIRGFLEMAVDEPALADHPAVRRPLERALVSAHRMTTMIEDLLEYASLGGQLRQDSVALAEICQNVLADLAAEQQRVAATVTVGFLPVVNGDPTQLRSVLQNLVANALKFHQPGRNPVVHIHATRVFEHWHVAVDDNGPGVPPALRNGVFELMDRGEQTQVPGTGIGLATCARVVEAHGGRIGIEESPAGGASVWFTLPIDDADRATNP